MKRAITAVLLVLGFASVSFACTCENSAINQAHPKNLAEVSSETVAETTDGDSGSNNIFNLIISLQASSKGSMLKIGHSQMMMSSLLTSVMSLMETSMQIKQKWVMRFTLELHSVFEITWCYEITTVELIANSNMFKLLLILETYLFSFAPFMSLNKLNYSRTYYSYIYIFNYISSSLYSFI